MPRGKAKSTTPAADKPKINPNTTTARIDLARRELEQWAKDYADVLAMYEQQYPDRGLNLLTGQMLDALASVYDIRRIEKAAKQMTLAS